MPRHLPPYLLPSRTPPARLRLRAPTPAATALLASTPLAPRPPLSVRRALPFSRGRKGNNTVNGRLQPYPPRIAGWRGTGAPQNTPDSRALSKGSVGGSHQTPA